MKLEPIELPNLYELRGYLEAVSDLVRTGQLRWYFDTKLFEMDVSEFSIQELIKTAYPQSHPDSATRRRARPQERRTSGRRTAGARPAGQRGRSG